MKPTLSIIIPTYNEEDYLPILLTSLDEQTFRDFEIIVADNASVDITTNIAVAHGAFIVSGGLPGIGRNRGANVARAELLLFLDADVKLPPNFLERLLQEFSTRQLDVTTCGVVPMSDRQFDVVMHRLYNGWIAFTASFAPFAPGFCILTRTSLHHSIGGFDESIVLAEDSDYVTRAAKQGRFGILKEVTIHGSIRRLDRDGRWNVITKMILSGIYYKIFGPIRTNLFNYTFGHTKRKIIK